MVVEDAGVQEQRSENFKYRSTEISCTGWKYDFMLRRGKKLEHLDTEIRLKQVMFPPHTEHMLFPIIETNYFVPYKELISVYYYNHTKRINSWCVKT